MMPRWIVPGGIALLAVGVGVVAVLRRPTVADPGPGNPVPAVPGAGGAPAPSLKAPLPKGPKPAVSARPDAPTPVKAGPLPAELQAWREAVLSKDAERLDHARHRLGQVDERYRKPLMGMAAEDRDPRVRTATVEFLAERLKPPGEAFFIERLGSDGHDGPREAAARALERYGTVKALEILDRVMENEQNAKPVRSRAARAALVIRRRAKTGR